MRPATSTSGRDDGRQDARHEGRGESRSVRRLLLVAGLLLLASPAAAQDPAPAAPDAPRPEPKALMPREADGTIKGGPPPASPNTPPQGTTARETMWRAPTAEDWAKPCLLTWQRSWDDALAVSKATNRPILICVNMDGEIASEHYAGVRYRQPEIAKLYEPYVTVIASVYRHTPRDYDDEGRRIPCPRFGGVTCGEHIAIEPVLFEKYFDGARISPRHVLIGMDGKELFDVYYANDTASVFSMVEEGAAPYKDLPPPKPQSDRPILERVASRDVRDRTAVEGAYREGDAAQRKALLESAIKNNDAAQIDLMRQAIFGLDPDLAKSAREALAKTDAPNAPNLISDALRVPMSAEEKEALLAALERLGTKSQRAQWLSVIHRGLSGKSDAVDTEAWTKARTQYEAPSAAKEWNALEIQRAAAAEAARAKPEDATARIAFAEACVALGLHARTSSEEDAVSKKIVFRSAFDDARAAAEEARKLGAPEWRVESVLAVTSYYGGDVEGAYKHAEIAAKQIPPGEPTWNSMAVLTMFAESRFQAIKKAVKAKQRWPARWLADLNATYAVLLRHPLGTDTQIVWHHDFLVWLGANDQAGRFLDEGLARYPASSLLHERFRKWTVERKGLEALESAYERMLSQPDAAPAIRAYAAAAATTVADFHRRAARRDEAMAAFTRAITHWEAAITANVTDRRLADSAVALAMASRARLAYEAGDFDRCLAEIVGSFERSPSTAGTRDGGGFTPGETAQMLNQKLVELGHAEAQAKLQGALSKIDPELLRFDRP